MHSLSSIEPTDLHTKSSQEEKNMWKKKSTHDQTTAALCSPFHLLQLPPCSWLKVQSPGGQLVSAAAWESFAVQLWEPAMP